MKKKEIAMCTSKYLSDTKYHEVGEYYEQRSEVQSRLSRPQT